MRKWLCLAISVILFGAAVGGGTVAWFTSNATSAQSEFTAGTLEVVVSGSFSIDGDIQPGDSWSREVTITNAGTIDMQFVAELRGQSCNSKDVDIADKVNVTVSYAEMGATVFSGTLKELMISPIKWAPGTTHWVPGTPNIPFVSGETATFVFEFDFDKEAGNEFQGAGWEGQLFVFANQWSNPNPFPMHGMQLWLDASTISGLAEGDKVEVWEDQSGNGIEVVQPIAEYQPVYREQSEINGMPALDFDRSYFDLGKQIVQQGEFTRFIVVRNRDWAEDNNSSPFFFGSSFSNRGAKAGLRRGEFFLRITDEPGRSRIEDWPFATKPGIITMQRDAASQVYVRFNGRASSYQPYFIDHEDAPLELIGCGQSNSQFWTGEIAEILIYNRALSEEEVRAVEEYLSAKYGI